MIGNDALPEAVKAMPAHSDASVEFFAIAEAGALEAQALLLCESIRTFAGRYARCPIAVISPRSDRRPARSTVRQLDRLGVEYLPLEVDSCCPEYGPSYRVHSVAHLARRAGPPVIVQLDSDTVFIGEPDFSLDGHDAAARPVDVKGMCATGSGAFDGYWKKLSGLVGVDYEQIPIVETTVDRVKVRASYNAGLFVARRECAIFEATENILRRLVAARLMPWHGGPRIRTGAGMLSGAATNYWGTSQAALSLALVAGHRRLRLFSPAYNFPLHLLDRFRPDLPEPLVHIHYHWLFSEQSSDHNPVLNGALAIPKNVQHWLKARLPLHDHNP